MGFNDNPWSPSGSHRIPREELDEQQESLNSYINRERFDTQPINPTCLPKTVSTPDKLKIRWTPEKFTEQKLRLRKVQHGEHSVNPELQAAQERAGQHLVPSLQQRTPTHTNKQAEPQQQVAQKKETQHI